MNCSFCNKKIEPGTGIMVVDVKGKIHSFNSRKCERNMLHLKRDSRKYKWARGELNE